MRGRDSQIVVIDASTSGVSGDKYLGALVDLGGELKTLKKVAQVVSENLPGTVKVDIKAVGTERGEIRAQQVIVESEEKVEKRKGTEILEAAEQCGEKLGLSKWALKFALSTVQSLLTAESKVHGHTEEEVELHELGSADTLVDILGVAAMADSLGLSDATWWSSPVAVGGGTSRFSNRNYPNPPPAAAEILRQNHFPIDQSSEEGELSTPTGVAITVNLVHKFSPSYPTLIPEQIGYGAGSKELVQVANVLRLTVGKPLESLHSHDEIVMLETNLDDVSGEVIGRAAEKLMASGARDVTIAPVYMKKNRPGHIISIIAKRDDVEKLADILIAETGTLGIRELPILRHISPRKIAEITVKVKGQNQRIRAKLSQDHKGRVVGGKLEYEDLRRISEETGVSIRDIKKMAQPKLDALQG